MTGMPTGPPEPQYVPADEVPEWMPRPDIDNIRVHKQQFSDWLKSSDWDALDPPGKEAGLLYLKTLLDLEAKEAQREAELQQQQAEQMGTQNAAKPQMAAPLPSLPSANGQQQ